MQLIDAKMKLDVLKLNEVLDVMHSLVSAQQGGDEEEKEVNEGEVPINKDEIPDVNLINPYQTRKNG